MFPSLRDNLCYIENTAEAITSSLIDGNHDVLVKSSWALGNLTNALLINRFAFTDNLHPENVLILIIFV